MGKMKPVCEPSARASRELDILHHIYDRAGRACNEKGQKHLGDFEDGRLQEENGLRKKIVNSGRTLQSGERDTD